MRSIFRGSRWFFQFPEENSRARLVSKSRFSLVSTSFVRDCGIFLIRLFVSPFEFLFSKSLQRGCKGVAGVWLCNLLRLQNSRIFCVGLSNKCARSLNERSGASVKTESGTGKRRPPHTPVARFAREDPRFRRFAPCDQRFREKNDCITYCNMLFCSQLGPECEWSDLGTAATIEEPFTHTARDVAQLDARAAQAHDACTQTNNTTQSNNSTSVISSRNAREALRDDLNYGSKKPCSQGLSL